MFNLIEYLSSIFKSGEGEIERDLFLERLDTEPLDDILTSIKILGNKEDNLESCILELTRKHGNFSVQNLVLK